MAELRGDLNEQDTAMLLAAVEAHKKSIEYFMNSPGIEIVPVFVTEFALNGILRCKLLTERMNEHLALLDSISGREQ